MKIGYSEKEASGTTEKCNSEKQNLTNGNSEKEQPGNDNPEKDKSEK